jgi:hypothetical protein
MDTFKVKRLHGHAKLVTTGVASPMRRAGTSEGFPTPVRDGPPELPRLYGRRVTPALRSTCRTSSMPASGITATSRLPVSLIHPERDRTRQRPRRSASRVIPQATTRRIDEPDYLRQALRTDRAASDQNALLGAAPEKQPPGEAV